MLELVLIQTLTLALFGGILYFAFRSFKREMLAQVRTVVRSGRGRVKTVAAENQELKQRLDQLDIRVRREKGLPDFNLNPFKDMESRYEKNLNTVVSVNGEEVQTAS
jgi:hypothetical protein